MSGGRGPLKVLGGSQMVWWLEEPSCAYPPTGCEGRHCRQGGLTSLQIPRPGSSVLNGRG